MDTDRRCATNTITADDRAFSDTIASCRLDSNFDNTAGTDATHNAVSNLNGIHSLWSDSKCAQAGHTQILPRESRERGRAIRFRMARFGASGWLCD
jgi:hypothetical protein